MMKTNWVQKILVKEFGVKRFWNEKKKKYVRKYCKKIVCLKKLCPKRFLTKKIQSKKNSGPKRFWSRKMGGPKISVQKNVRSKKCKARKILVQKFVCVQNILSKNFKYIRIWIQKNFWSTKKIWDQKNSGPKNGGPKNISTEKFKV